MPSVIQEARWLSKEGGEGGEGGEAGSKDRGESYANTFSRDTVDKNELCNKKKLNCQPWCYEMHPACGDVSYLPCPDWLLPCLPRCPRPARRRSTPSLHPPSCAGGHWSRVLSWPAHTHTHVCMYHVYALITVTLLNVTADFRVQDFYCQYMQDVFFLSCIFLKKHNRKEYVKKMRYQIFIGYKNTSLFLKWDEIHSRCTYTKKGFGFFFAFHC